MAALDEDETGRGALDPPPYRRGPLGAGIVHLGLGGFARAHLAAYVHDLMLIEPSAARWGIVGVGLRADDRPLLAALAAQDHLYTLVERDGAGDRRTVIGSLIATIDASEGAVDVLRVAALPEVALLSLTVTEHGYCLGGDRRLAMDHPAIMRDLDRPDDPCSAIGMIAAILSRRRTEGIGGMTVLSCDNIQHNGDVVRSAVLAYATALDPDLAVWIDAAVTFPNAMVDRITPRPTIDAAIALHRETGIADAAPLICEPFRQWALEDAFAGDRPPLERVGVQMVSDVSIYEHMKLWLLNASHLAMSGPAELMGIATVAEAVAHPSIARFLSTLIERETSPAIGLVPGIDLDDYAVGLMRRFANPALPDTVARINADAPISYLLDPLRAIRADGGDAPLLCLAIAFWLFRMRGRDERGQPIAVVHPLFDELQRRALSCGDDVRPLLELRNVFGDLADDDRTVDAISSWFASISSVGVSRALDDAFVEACPATVGNCPAGTSQDGR